MTQKIRCGNFSSLEPKGGDPGSNGNHKIKKLSNLFSLLGSDPEQNIRIIVQQACEVLACAGSLYNRLENGSASLISWTGHSLPPEFAPKKSPPSGHICFAPVTQDADEPVIIEDLSKTAYQQSDPNVQRYGLKAYMGYPVHCSGRTIGSLCIVDTQQRKFDEADIYIVCTLAKAISLEEERRKDQDALLQSEKKYRTLYKMMRLMADNVPDLIWAKDLDGRFMFANQAMCDKLLKCQRPENAEGKTDQDFADMAHNAGHEYTFAELCADTDNVIKRKKSAARFLEEGLVCNQALILDVHKAPFWDESGEIIGTVGCGRDVTNEKRTEKALQESERRYRELYNNTPVMLYSVDNENRLKSVSNLWLETLGYRREAVIGRSALEFLTPESRAVAIQAIWSELRQKGQIKNQPLQFVAQGGEIKNVLLSAIAQRDTQDRYAGALAFVVDVTDARRAEKENQRLSERLLQAQKMEAIGTLAGGIAHQFNNALAVILGNLELIQMEGLRDEKIDRYVEPISQAGQKMVQLTSQLLAYARGGKFQTQTMPAQDFVQDTLSLVSHSMASYVELHTNLAPDADHIEVDQTQMQMLLAAILSNASEAIQGQGRVQVSVRNEDVTAEQCRRHPGLKPGRYVLLCIEDDGQGMDAQTQERIFEPFFTTKFQGRGLGMAAVYGIMKKHGGNVYVESQLGEGTIVSLYLPSVAPAPQVAEEAPTYMARQAETVLIVEDEQLVMEVNRAIVEKLGYAVLEAKSGKEAVHIARNYQGRIDFVLLDVILPDMGGNQIYPLLMQARPDLKVIVCSGFALEGPAREILDAGAQCFIQKPFSVAALSAVIQDLGNAGGS